MQPPRTALPAGPGELLVMPAVAGSRATVKLVTVGGSPRIQGGAVVFVLPVEHFVKL